MTFTLNFSPSSPVKLEGSARIFSGTARGNFDDLPMDVPAGPDYVLGPGDGLKHRIVRRVSRRLQRLVDRQGRLCSYRKSVLYRHPEGT